MKKALVTGVLGQDGAYLSRLLLSRDYLVYGGFRRSSTLNTWRLAELEVLEHHNFRLIEYDITDASAANRLVSEIRPSEIYNLAAQSFVGVSFAQPMTTGQITGTAVLNLLEAIRLIDPTIRFYQASTSEMFGAVREMPQTETTPFYPRSPYGVAKLYAHWITVNYRESYDLFASSGILFNHESPLRGIEFVTRKISDSVAKMKLGHKEPLCLGNLDAKRDWGFAGEYVDGMWRMLQAKAPDTYVLATGRTESVRRFVTLAFEAAGLPVEFEGIGVEERARDKKSGEVRVTIDPKFFRPAEVDVLVGDAQKAEAELDWKASMSLERLCEEMVDADVRRLGL